MEPFIRRLPLNAVINIYACSGNQSILHVLFYKLFGPGPFPDSSKYGVCDVCYGWKRCAARGSLYKQLENNNSKNPQCDDIKIHIGRYMVYFRKYYIDCDDIINDRYKRCCSRICANVLLFRMRNDKHFTKYYISRKDNINVAYKNKYCCSIRCADILLNNIHSKDKYFIVGTCYGMKSNIKALECIWEVDEMV